MNKKTAGISLVALVITIIVLIILTGTVIMTFMEGGIVDRAREAVFKSDIATYQEILAMKKAEYQLEIATGNTPEYDLERITAEEMKDFMPELKDDYIGIFEVVNGELVLAAGYEEVATTQQIAVLEKVGLIVSTGESEGGNSSNASKITDWEYYINGTDVILTKYIGADTEVVVPATYYLAKDAYYAGNTAGTYNVVVQPNTTSYLWPDTYTVDANGGLFANTNITSVTFETGVTVLRDCYYGLPYMFANCTSLTTVNNLPSISYACEEGPFKNCTSLKEITLMNEANVNYAEWYYFRDCGASEVTIKVEPGSQYAGMTYEVGTTTVTVVEKEAGPKVIAGAEDWEAYISGTDIILTKYIGTETEVYVPATYYIEKNAYYKGNAAGTYNVKVQPNSTAARWQTTYEISEDGGLFANNTSITSVEFADGVQLMSDCWSLIPYMFANCTSLETITNLPNNNGEYCYSPFKNCPSLKEVSLIPFEYFEYRVEVLFGGCGSSAVTVKVPADSSYVGQTYNVGDTTITVVAK